MSGVVSPVGGVGGSSATSAYGSPDTGFDSGTFTEGFGQFMQGFGGILQLAGQNQRKAANQVGNYGQESPGGAQGAGGSQGCGQAQGAGGSGQGQQMQAILAALMQLLQMVAQLLQQQAGGDQGDPSQGMGDTSQQGFGGGGFQMLQ